MANGKYSDLLKSGGFQAFLWTQFLGAFNDNVYKLVVSFIATEIPGAGSRYLSLAGVVFMVPFFLFSGYSGHLADVVSKRKVLVGVKVFEIAVMTLGLLAFFAGRIELMLGVLFLMALHSTIFSPAKYGIVPEMLPDKDLSRANGLLEMSTFVAIVFGTAIAGFMYTGWKTAPWKIGACLMAIAFLGMLTSLKIPKVAPAGGTRKFDWNPWGEVVIGTKHLLKDKPLWLTVMGISYFWFLGALFQLTLLVFGKEDMHQDDIHIALLATCLAIGIGAGSMVAGRLSGDKVEIGLVPLGSVGMVVFCLLVSGSASSYVATAILLALLGFSSGLFIVPLNAYLQERCDPKEKGRILATNNFWNTVGILLASGTLWLMHDYFHLRPAHVLLTAGLLTIASTAYIVLVVPDFLIRFCFWMLTHTIYKIEIVGQENVPSRGPALLVSNHVSLVDAFLVAACVQRFIRFMIYKPIYENKIIQPLFRLMKAIPVSAGRRDVIESLRTAQKQLLDGHVVCIFAEGAISRTGNLLPFKKGLERIANETNAPIIPVHLDRVWGSIFSFDRGKFIWKWPTKIPHPVTVSFGKPLPSTATAHEVRQAVMVLAADAYDHRRGPRDVLPLRFIETAKRHRAEFAIADSSGKELTYGEVLIASLMLTKWVRKNCEGESVGLLLPASIGATLANVAVSMDGRVAVNLNFTAGPESMGVAIEQCKIKNIITSRLFLSKAKLAVMPGMVYLEDAMKGFSGLDKALAAAQVYLLPSGLLQRMHATKQRPNTLAAVMFSSGSTGIPKGVMLSNHNVLSNVESMAQLFSISTKDCMLAALPPFHSFGFTTSMWFPLIAACGAAYHVTPLDAKVVGELAEKYKCTLLLSTPTFSAMYARKCTREQFSNIRYFLVGAERLRESIVKTYEDDFGISLLEGYGATEMSPVIAVSRPDVVDGAERQVAHKKGSVGHPMPGIAAKVVNPDTFEELPPNKEGLLLVYGPTRMMGYLNDPEKTASVMRDGWYITGDIVCMDEDGFIRITDRLSRFSKIGGEMVPHLKLEEAVNAMMQDGVSAVTAIPDEQKGECLVVFYTDKSLQPQDIMTKLAETELPKLWLPKRDNIHFIEALPTLGTGKLDLRQTKLLAQQLAKQ